MFFRKILSAIRQSDEMELRKNTKFCIVLADEPHEACRISRRALDDLRAFPAAARREAGHQLDYVQRDRDPDDWKPMSAIGKGVQEIRIRGDAGAFRLLYVAKFADAVYVLHCFQKKTQRTSKTDLELAKTRYADLVKELRK